VRAEDVAHRAQVLARPARRELGAEPLAQQPGAAVVVVIDDGGRGQRGERRARQLVERLLAVRREVGDAVVTGMGAQRGRHTRVEIGEAADVVIGKGAHAGGRGRFGRRGHHRIMPRPAAAAGLDILVP
jgi:hypothetical protein